MQHSSYGARVGRQNRGVWRTDTGEKGRKGERKGEEKREEKGEERRKEKEKRKKRERRREEYRIVFIHIQHICVPTQIGAYLENGSDLSAGSMRVGRSAPRACDWGKS